VKVILTLYSTTVKILGEGGLGPVFYMFHVIRDSDQRSLASAKYDKIILCISKWKRQKWKQMWQISWYYSGFFTA
jgi:hypothetical protein